MYTKAIWTYIFIVILLPTVFISCFSDSKKQEIKNSTRNNEKGAANYSEEEDQDESNDEYSSSSGCNFEDGTFSATVDYYNSETGYSQTYTLDVEVEDCEVIRIEFPNGGWLDSDHITPAELDDDGTCTIQGEEGKTYDIQIDI
jgi:hypothetical protein